MPIRVHLFFYRVKSFFRRLWARLKNETFEESADERQRSTNIVERNKQDMYDLSRVYNERYKINRDPSKKPKEK